MYTQFFRKAAAYDHAFRGNPSLKLQRRERWATTKPSDTQRKLESGGGRYADHPPADPTGLAGRSRLHLKTIAGAFCLQSHSARGNLTTAGAASNTSMSCQAGSFHLPSARPPEGQDLEVRHDDFSDGANRDPGQALRA